MGKVKYKCCEYNSGRNNSRRIYFTKETGARFLPSEAQLNSVRDLSGILFPTIIHRSLLGFKGTESQRTLRGFNVSRVIHVAKWAWTVLTLRTAFAEKRHVFAAYKGSSGTRFRIAERIIGFFTDAAGSLNPAPDVLASSVIEFPMPTAFPRPANLRSSFRRHSCHALFRFNFINSVSSITAVFYVYREYVVTALSCPYIYLILRCCYFFLSISLRFMCVTII